ncbi:hypothetical protein LNP74_08620 [Klebsiella pneumoniae subsp. pneumoniae]|nr:hypothetical protein [Klebsiella pneumoniae subsp. pneumoniae]
MRYTSGTGSEALMGYSESKSMLYLESRCIFITKGAGVQGLQNGAVSCIGMTGAVPSGIRAVLAENLIASMLDLEWRPPTTRLSPTRIFAVPRAP